MILAIETLRWQRRRKIDRYKSKNGFQSDFFNLMIKKAYGVRFDWIDKHLVISSLD